MYNVHRLFAVLMLIAAKFAEDDILTNAYWSDICGIEFEELNHLEDVFCFKSDFNFYVDMTELAQLYKEFGLERFCPIPDFASEMSSL